MKLFSELYECLNSTSSTNFKIELLQSYFQKANWADQAWAIYFLSGGRLKRLVKSTDLRRWILVDLNIPQWLFEDSYAVVGDLAETLTLLLQKSSLNLPTSKSKSEESALSLSCLIESVILPLKNLPQQGQLAKLREIWSRYQGTDLYLIHKFITGGLRVGVSKRLVHRALAKVYDLDESFIARHFMGYWEPNEQIIADLIQPEKSAVENPAKPYPFCLASPLDKEPAALGALSDWFVEWKWDGIRAQFIKRSGQVFIWSRGEELVNDQFPEIVEEGASVPDGVVLDGEILVWQDNRPSPFHYLQTRLGRKKPSKKLQGQYPCVLLAYDLIEVEATDIRELPLKERKSRLDKLQESLPDEAKARFLMSNRLNFNEWADLKIALADAPKMRAEGYMLKSAKSSYKDGRRKGYWWKWKMEPYHLDVVLIYAQAGHGRRANLYTDYTLAVWDEDNLVPIAKAYSGLNQQEIERLDRWIKRNTEEKFGPVRKVAPVQVLQIAFEGISPSNRHKSGLALRFPRIARWREDKLAKDADTLKAAHDLLATYLQQR